MNMTYTDKKSLAKPAQGGQEGYDEFAEVLHNFSALRETSISKLSENLPREHAVRAKNQYDGVQRFNAEILDEV